MKSVQDAMRYRRQHDARGYDNDQATIQSVKASEQFSGFRCGSIDGSHATKEHGGIQK